LAAGANLVKRLSNSLVAGHGPDLQRRRKAGQWNKENQKQKYNDGKCPQSEAQSTRVAGGALGWLAALWRDYCIIKTQTLAMILTFIIFVASDLRMPRPPQNTM
jgi:hypothetical protein